jgi:hypothetical protein
VPSHLPPAGDADRLRLVRHALWLVSVSVAFGVLSGVISVTTGPRDHSLLALAALALYDTLGWWQADRIAALVVVAVAAIEAWRTTRPRRSARSDSVRPG